MRAWSAGLALWALTPTLLLRPMDVSFHHIHVNDPSPSHLVSYYGRLFRPDTTRPTSVGEVLGIESNGVFLLIDAARGMPPESGSAGWHFGWGTVSVDEAYDRHRMQEIEWELPLESFSKDLHVHLESVDPVAAAEWYRDILGATLELSPAAAAVQPGSAPYIAGRRRLPAWTMLPLPFTRRQVRSNGPAGTASTISRSRWTCETCARARTWRC